MKDTYKTYALMRGNEVLREDWSDETITIPISSVKSVKDIWTDSNKDRLEFMLAEYETRLKGFRVVEIEIVQTFEISVV